MHRLRLALPIFLLLMACADKERARQLKENADINAVLDSLETRQPGFVPSEEKIGFSAFRHAEREKFGKELQGVIGKGGKTVQVATRRLYADVRSFSARHMSDRAVKAWSQLANDSADLLIHVSKLDRISGQIQMFNRNETELLEALNDQRLAINQRLQRDQAEIEQLQSRIEEYNTAVTNHEVERQSKESEAARLSLEVRAASGTKIIDLSESAREAARAAERAEAAKKQEQLKIEILSSEMQVVKRRHALTDEVSQAIERQIEGIQKRHAEVADAMQSQRKQWDDHQMQFDAAFAKVMEAYHEEVETVLAEATGNMNEAIEVAEREVSLSSRDGRQIAELDLVAMKLGKIHVLAEHITAQGSVGHTLMVVAAGVDDLFNGASLQGLQTNAPPTYGNQVKELSGKQEALVHEALELIADGLSQATEIAESGDEDIVEAAESYAALFEGYRSRIEQSELDVSKDFVDRTPLPPSAGTGVAGALSMNAVTVRSARTPAPTTIPLDDEATESEVVLVATPVVEVAPVTTPVVEAAPITGELPPVPEEAVGDQTAMLLWIDGRLLNPVSLRETAKTLLGPNASLVDQPIDMFAGMYAQFAQTGGTSILLSAMAPDGPAGEEPEGTLYVSMKEETQADGIMALLRQQAKSEVELVSERQGDWLAVRRSDIPAPAPADDKRRPLFEQALQAVGANPLTMVVVPTVAMRNTAMGFVDMVSATTPTEGAGLPPEEQLASLLEDASWFAVTIKLHEQFGLYTTAKMVDDETATEVVESINVQLNELTAGGQAQGPMAMFLPMIRGAIQVEQDGDFVRVNFAGPGLNTVVSMAAPMLAGFFEGGMETEIDMDAEKQIEAEK